MKIKKLMSIVLVLLFMLLLLIYPENGVKGAVRGLIMCSDIVIPSLFPFCVCVLFLYKAGFFNLIKSKLSGISRFLFGINGECFSIFIMSFLGGYPIGAILIEKAYEENKISKRNAENMLNYCINSGPAFIIIGIGNGIFFNIKIGVLLFFSNFLASLFLALILKRYSVYEQANNKSLNHQNITDTFVEATAEVSKSILSVCSYVVLFSTVIGMISAIPNIFGLNKILSLLLEVTNACVISGKNIYLLSFLLGFGGFSIHFQILSVLKKLKPSYIKFLIGRVLHGLFSMFFTLILFKIFPVHIQTISGLAYSGSLTSISLPFSAALIFMCSTFLFSIKNKNSGKFE